MRRRRAVQVSSVLLQPCGLLATGCSAGQNTDGAADSEASVLVRGDKEGKQNNRKETRADDSALLRYLTSIVR